jgi:hypothetical protein
MDISCVVQVGGERLSSRVESALFEIAKWSSSVAPAHRLRHPSGFLIINSIAGTKGQDARPLAHPDIGYSIGDEDAKANRSWIRGIHRNVFKWWQGGCATKTRQPGYE